MYLKKIIIWVSSLVIIGLFEIWTFYPHSLYTVIVSLFFTVSFSIWFVLVHKVRAKESVNFFLPIGVFILSAGIFFTLIDQPVIRHFFIVLTVIGYFVEMQNIFTFLYHPDDYQPYALENINGYINLASFFLLVSSLYGVILFFSWPNWLAIVCTFCFASFFSWRAFHAFKIDWSISKVYIIVIGLVLAETALIINFLPTSYLFNGMVIIIMYYLLLNYLRDYLRHMYDKRLFLRYILISISGLILGLLTTRWF
ncbi:MAG: hypothetical protein WC570_01105 [Patescibacteria group bacterium]